MKTILLFLALISTISAKCAIAEDCDEVNLKVYGEMYKCKGLWGNDQHYSHSYCALPGVYFFGPSNDTSDPHKDGELFKRSRQYWGARLAACGLPVPRREASVGTQEQSVEPNTPANNLASAMMAAEKRARAFEKEKSDIAEASARRARSLELATSSRGSMKPASNPFCNIPQNWCHAGPGQACDAERAPKC